MRISLVTDTCPPEINGVTTVVETMRQGLLARGHAVQIVAPRYGLTDRESFPDAQEPDRPVVRRPALSCPGYPAARVAAPWDAAAGRALMRFAPEVVHAVTEGPLGWVGRRFALRTGVPLVTSFHTDFPRYAQRYVGDWAVGPTRRYLRRFHAPAHHTQTPSRVARDELRSLGVRRAVVWGRGVDTTRFAPVRRCDARRTALGAGHRTVVLHVGRLAVEKDLDTLARAFRLAHDALGARAVFCLAGDGPDAASARAALPFAVHLGFLPRDVLAELYASADLFVLTSPTETCGLVVLEAMASGLPVVAADTGGVLENLRHGLNGLLAPAGDATAFARAIVALVRDAPQRMAMGQAARAFAVARDWARELDALEPLYHFAATRRLPAAELADPPVVTA